MTGAELRDHRRKAGLSQAKLSELCGIPQHHLSAFELDKNPLSDRYLADLTICLSNVKEVQKLAKRAKRYRFHEYSEVRLMPERIRLAKRTDRNQEYVAQLGKLWNLHTQCSERRFSALSLFSGCGGFSLGFSAAGFAVKACLELDPNILSIYKQNFPGAAAMGGDITSIGPERLCTLANRLGPVDVIIGGPPCQGFSLAGKREKTDPRNALFNHYLRFIDAFRPKVAVLENVKLLTSMKNANGGYVQKDIESGLSQHGYNVKLFEINAKNYGVPQHRERALFIATKKNIALSPECPFPTHGNAGGLFTAELPYRTFADACSDLPFIESGQTSNDPLHVAVRHPSHVIEWLWDVKQGDSAHGNADPAKRPPSGYNTTYKRQVWGEPAATVQTTFGMISGCRNVHPIATRSLTIREAARIQSFPDEFRLVGSSGSIRTAIGNAVPPLLAYEVAAHLSKQLQSL